MTMLEDTSIRTSLPTRAAERDTTGNTTAGEEILWTPRCQLIIAGDSMEVGGLELEHYPDPHSPSDRSSEALSASTILSPGPRTERSWSSGG